MYMVHAVHASVTQRKHAREVASIVLGCWFVQDIQAASLACAGTKGEVWKTRRKRRTTLDLETPKKNNSEKLLLVFGRG